MKKITIYLLLVISVLLSSAPLFTLENNESDAFGDPFGQNEETPESATTDEDPSSPEPEEDISLPSGPEKTSPGLNRNFSISGEAGYFPLIKIEPEKDPVFVLNRVTDITHINYSFGDSSVTGSFQLGIDPDASTEACRFTVDELFFSYHYNFSTIKAGYMALDWSLMNVFKLTNYFFTPAAFYFDLDVFDFNPHDLDMVIDYSPFAIEDPGTDGAAGLYVFFYYNIFSLELMVSPPSFFHNQSSPLSEALSLFTFPSHVTLSLVDTPPPLEISNVEIAARLGITLNSTDIYLSYFHGFDKRMFYTTTTALALPSDLDIMIKREYTLVDKAGASASIDLFGLMINSEAVLNFSDPVMYYKTTHYPDPPGDIIDMKQTETTSIEISTGCDWEIIPDIRLICEYNDYFLLEKIPDVMEETLNGDTLFGALRYTLVLPRLEIIFMPGIRYDFSGHEITSINYIECDFLNGFTIDFALYYFYITEETDATSDNFKIMNEDTLFGVFFHINY
ncbi:MAG: hypothetical protein JXJ04_02985 [Spirochaetales bacterium]|nr:hypothetical protein [Spirochaetales bacterium]